MWAFDRDEDDLCGKPWLAYQKLAQAELTLSGAGKGLRQLKTQRTIMSVGL